MNDPSLPAPDTAARVFTEVFGAAPEVVVGSPGRVNLIGDHTDYNAGVALPMAIDRHVWIALRPRPDHTVRVMSRGRGSWVDLHLGETNKTTDWGRYVDGVARELLALGLALVGWEGVIVSSLPDGAGLSSSAALELAVARAFVEASGLPWEPREVAMACQRAENRWVGVNCGIMDQLASALGRQGHAMLIDFADLSVDSVAIPDEVAVVVLDTGTRRRLADSEYNLKRSQCETAAHAMGVRALGELSRSDLPRADRLLDDLVFRRLRHVVTEIGLTRDAADALGAGDLHTVGSLMTASHASLRDDYQVSSPALDTMADIARATPGCFGARMTGAGFGGSVVALVGTASAQAISAEIIDRYTATTGTTGRAMAVSAAEGTAVVS